jgi:hypothetical protein
MLKKQIEEKISKTEIFNINKKTAEFILQKLNEFLDKEDSIFILMDVMKCTDYSYHTIRKYINAIIAFKPSLVVKLDRYRYMLNNRNKADLHGSREKAYRFSGRMNRALAIEFLK